jgi:Ca2+-binding EF-hand superfamily protein
MNRISLLVAVCLVLGVCINMATSEEDLSHIFSLFDTNSDMAIDKDEINKFASEHLGNVDLTPYIEYFHQADQNGDGMIQCNEFETIYRIIPDLHIF